MVKSIRTAGYGPVCPVVWEGGGREAAPYPDSGTNIIARDLMWALAGIIEKHAEEDAKALYELNDAQAKSMYAFGLDLIFFGWDGLEALSEIANNWVKYAIEVAVTIQGTPQTH